MSAIGGRCSHAGAAVMARQRRAQPRHKIELSLGRVNEPWRESANLNIAASAGRHTVRVNWDAAQASRRPMSNNCGSTARRGSLKTAPSTAQQCASEMRYTAHTWPGRAAPTLAHTINYITLACQRPPPAPPNRPELDAGSPEAPRSESPPSG